MKSNSMQSRLRLWTILLVVIPSILIMTIYTIGQIKEVKEKNIEIISQRVEFQNHLINNWIEERARDIRVLSQMEAFRSLDEQQMINILDVMQRNITEFDSLSFIDKDGLYKMSTLRTEIKYPSANGMPYYVTAVAGKEYISDVVVGRNSGLPIINISSPIYDKSGVFQGLILGSVHTKTIETLLRNNWTGQTGEILLVNSDGTMIAEPRYVQKLFEKGSVGDDSKIRIKLSDDALKNIHIGANGSASWRDYLGRQVMGSYQFIPERGWTLIGSISEEEIFAPIYTQLAIMAAGTFLLVLLLLPLATLLTNQIKRPIDWLVAQSILVGEEKYELVGRDKNLVGMPDELGRLCESFVIMSHRIACTFNLIKEQERALGSKVREIQSINAVLQDEIMERQNAQSALEKINVGLEEEVERRTAEIAQLDRLNLVGEMAAGIGHEVRNPMTTVRGYLQLFQKKEKFAEYQKQLSTMIEELDRANGIITEFLTLAKDKRIEHKPGNINNIIETLFPLLHANALRSGHSISLQTSSIADVAFDEREVRQLVLNLVRNAFEAMVNGGTVILTTYQENNNIVLAVQDTGHGIPEHVQKKIGTPFMTTKDTGTGLGLSVCYRIVQRHDAKLEFKTGPNGTTFFVKFHPIAAMHLE